MRRVIAMFAVLLVSSGGLAGCTSAAINSHSSVGRFTLQIRLDTTKVDVGTPISGTATLRNGTNKSFSWDNCFGSSVDVGLVGHGATFNPIVGTSCFSKKAFKPHSSMRYPVTVQTTYDGCGFSGVPKCPQDGIPLLPLGSYTVDVVKSGLPTSIEVLHIPKVMLVNATTGRSVGPRGGSILVQAYGCETISYPQPPISIVLDKGGRMIARRSQLAISQEMVVGVSPGSYVIRSNVRPTKSVHVKDGVQAVVTVIPRCN